jgi:hypothetical protein
MPTPTPAPFSIGVIPLQFEDLNAAALKYFVLHLNMVQTAFEFEMLPPNDDQVLHDLSTNAPLDRLAIRESAPQFVERYLRFLELGESNYGLRPQPPQHLIVVCAANFRDEFYITQRGQLTVIALGNWSAAMAPPSLLEFVYILLIRTALAAAFPALTEARHYATRGCIFDFSANLEDARFKVLNAYLCHRCSRAIDAAASPGLVNEVTRVLQKEWVGNPAARGTPAAIMRKLGYDLFLTSGVRPTAWERFKDKLEEEWLKQSLDFVAKLLLAAALFWLGLRARE